MSKEKNSRHNDLPESEGFKDTRSVSSNKDSGQITSSRTLTSRLYKQIQLIVAKIAMMLGRLVSSWSKGLKRFSAISVLVIVTILAGHTVSAQMTTDSKFDANPINGPTTQPVLIDPELLYPPAPGNPGPSQLLDSLKKVSIPEPDNLKDFVQDKTAAIALGKSLFWDMQLGIDGIQSCASCHFHAGADSRSKNQLNPGPGNVFDIGGRPNYQLTAADYPFHKLSDTNSRSSTVISDSNDITGSQGVFKSDFVEVNPGSDKDIVNPTPDKVFNVNDINVRQVTGRNSPTMINAVFNFRNFWDGRAQNNFNGVNEFGLRDPSARVFKAINFNKLLEVPVNLKNSSLASQAVGPPLSAFETAADNFQDYAPNRVAPLETVTLSEATGEITVVEASKQDVINNASGEVNIDSLFAVSSANTSNTNSLSNVSSDNISDTDSSSNASSNRVSKPLPSTQLPPLKRKGRKLGKKLTVLRPLAKQLVAKDDSILGSYSQGSQPGLNVETYSTLIQQAFKPEWWKSNLVIQVNPKTGARTYFPKPAGSLSTNQYTLMEYNFSLFFGLAVQAYESTLVSDNSPFDQYFEGNSSALSDRQKRGLKVFQNQGKCINCHGGAEFTNASVKNVQDEKIERMRMGNGGVAVYDNGFYNIGVRPTFEDLGVGGKDPFGNPLSFTKYTQEQVAQGKIRAPILKAIPEEDIPEGPLEPNERAAVDGAFKVPGLRNVELTAPYFHNGGQATLEQVVEFYNRGGDFHQENIANLDADIQNLNLSAENKADLVAFLKSLTDDRVRYDKAPFDHPQLCVPNGHPGDQNLVTDRGNGQATDQLIEIKAVGRDGNKGTPNFLDSSNQALPGCTIPGI